MSGRNKKKNRTQEFPDRGAFFGNCRTRYRESYTRLSGLKSPVAQFFLLEVASPRDENKEESCWNFYQRQLGLRASLAAVESTSGKKYPTHFHYKRKYITLTRRSCAEIRKNKFINITSLCVLSTYRKKKKTIFPLFLFLHFTSSRVFTMRTFSNQRRIQREFTLISCFDNASTLPYLIYRDRILLARSAEIIIFLPFRHVSRNNQSK